MQSIRSSAVPKFLDYCAVVLHRHVSVCGYPLGALASKSTSQQKRLRDLNDEKARLTAALGILV